MKSIYQKIIFAGFLILLNIAGIILVGIVFLGTSNANGEGAPVESAFISFLRMFTYALVVSTVISLLAFILKKVFRQGMPFNNFFIKHLFWVEFVFLLLCFFIPFAYIYCMTL